MTTIDGSTAESLYLSESGNHKLLNEEDERDLIIRAKDGDLQARDQLIKQNQRMVIGLARKYFPIAGDLELMDLVQWGNLGMIEAIGRFDVSKHLRFSTYAVWWVRMVMRRNAIRVGKRVSISESASEIMARISSAKTHLYQVNHKDPTQEEIADYLHIPPSRIGEVWNTYQGVMSLDQTATDTQYGDDMSIGEITPDEGTSPEELCENREAQDKVKTALQSVDPALREVLIFRFGLDGSEPMTLDQVSTLQKCSRETVRRREYLAKQAFARALTKGQIKDYENKDSKESS